jgi:hypothetical protein
MRYLVLLLTMFALSALAEDHVIVTNDVHCFKKDVIIEQLRGQFDEEPIVIGKSTLEKGAVLMLYVNQQTGTYTVLTTGSGVACILDTGGSVRYRMPKALDNKSM